MFAPGRFATRPSGGFFYSQIERPRLESTEGPGQVHRQVSWRALFATEAHIMRRYIAAVSVGALLYCACIVTALAAPVTVSWTHPTSYSDGSTLAVADIATTTVEYSSGTTFGTVAGQAVVTGPAATTVIDRPPGSWCFRARTTVVAARGGQTSDPSNVACLSVAFPAPNPPTIIDVIIAWLRSIFARWV